MNPEISDSILPLSVCLIARNEENNLPRALRSLRGSTNEVFVREIIVCDTGSTDRTPELARAAGARVVHEPWQDDFARARNAAIAAASSDWILMIDADEELLPESIPALHVALRRPVLAQIVHNHLLYPISSLVGGIGAGGAGGAAGAGGAGGEKEQVLAALRLFRRHEGIRYRGRVHESVAESLLALGASEWPDSGVHLRHHGYLEGAERRRKGERNLRLLEEAVAEEPDNLYLGYKLAQTLPRSEGPRSKTLLRRLAERALALPTAELTTLPFLPALFARTGAALLGSGELLAASRLCQRGAERLGKSLWFSAGKTLLHAGALPAAEAALWRYLQEGSATDAIWQSDPEASPTAARHLLGQAALLSQHYGPAERLLKEAIAAATPATYPAMACDLIRVFMRSGRMHAAVAGLTDLTGLAGMAGGQSADDVGRYREVMLLSAEVSVLLGDIGGALPLAQAALDPEGVDDRATALLATLMMRTSPPNPSGALALLPLLPGTRYDTLAVRLWLGKLFGRGQRPQEVPLAAMQALQELEATVRLGGLASPPVTAYAPGASP